MYKLKKEKTINGNLKWTIIKSKTGCPFGIRQGVYDTKRQAKKVYNKLKR